MGIGQLGPLPGGRRGDALGVVLQRGQGPAGVVLLHGVEQGRIMLQRCLLARFIDLVENLVGVVRSHRHTSQQQ